MRLRWLALDGMDWQLARNFCKQGKMPNFEKLLSKSAYAELDIPESPLISLRLWTSAFTGKAARKHGITDFYKGPESLKSKQIWEMLPFKLARGIFKPISAFRCKHYKGYFVPGIFSRTNETKPKSLKFIKDFEQKARRNKLGLKSLASFSFNFLKRKLGFPSLTDLSKALATHGIGHKKLCEFELNSHIYLKLEKRYEPKFSIFYDNSIDLISHFYWKSKILEKIYSKIDKFIGKLRNSESYLIISSDHGFRPSAGKSKLIPKVEPFIQELFLPLSGSKIVDELILSGSELAISKAEEKITKIRRDEEEVFAVRKKEGNLIVKAKAGLKKEDLFQGPKGKIKANRLLDFEERKAVHSEKGAILLIVGRNLTSSHE